MFPVVKLAAIPSNLISIRCSNITPNSIIINREEEWKVKKVPDSY